MREHSHENDPEVSSKEVQKMDHHALDIYPNPRDKSLLYINEPWIIDETADMRITDPDSVADNIRVFVPLDLN